MIAAMIVGMIGAWTGVKIGMIVVSTVAKTVTRGGRTGGEGIAGTGRGSGEDGDETESCGKPGDSWVKEGIANRLRGLQDTYGSAAATAAPDEAAHADRTWV